MATSIVSSTDWGTWIDCLARLLEISCRNVVLKQLFFLSFSIKESQTLKDGETSTEVKSTSIFYIFLLFSNEKYSQEVKENSKHINKK